MSAAQTRSDGPCRSATGQGGDALAGVVGLAEHHFLAMAERLDTALMILGRMNDKFGELQARWQDAGFGSAVQQLRATTAQIDAVIEVHHRDGTLLRDLERHRSELTVPARQMRTPIGEMVALSVNARLACAAVGSAGERFLMFASQIGQVAAEARRRTDTLQQGLVDLQNSLHTALAAQTDFDDGPGQAIAGIAQRVDAALARFSEASCHTSDAARAVHDRSTAIQASVVEVVRALQVGDTARQRIGHVQRIVALIAQPAYAPHAALGQAIAVAQLRDTADQLDAEAGRIVTLLQDLGGGARAMTELSGAAVGTSSDRPAEREEASALGVLQAEVTRTSAALAKLHDAFAAADTALAAVRKEVDGLAGQMASLSRMELDIRLLGLNTSLGAGRLGTVGRPLGVIAQALREHGKQIAAGAEAVRATLARILTQADTLSDSQRRDATDGLQQLRDTMAAAVVRLSEADQAFPPLLAGLEQDSSALATLLAEAMSGFSVHKEICVPLRQVADTLAPGASVDAVADATALLADIAAAYTMERERIVQARATGLAPPEAPVSPPPASDSLDDLML